MIDFIVTFATENMWLCILGGLLCVGLIGLGVWMDPPEGGGPR